MEIVPPGEVEHIHMPSPSWIPLIVTAHVGMILVGLLFTSFDTGVGFMGYVSAVLGALGIIYWLYRWVTQPV
jgi:hypothetical protein